MKKPVPKEVVIKNVGERILSITASTPDAIQQVENICKEFGSLHPPSDTLQSYLLIIKDTYNSDEVEAYLRYELGE